MQHYKVTRLTLTIDESSADVAEHARQQKVKAKVTLCAETARLQCKLESALCGDANPRRLQRQSCCG